MPTHRPPTRCPAGPATSTGSTSPTLRRVGSRGTTSSPAPASTPTAGRSATTRRCPSTRPASGPTPSRCAAGACASPPGPTRPATPPASVPSARATSTRSATSPSSTDGGRCGLGSPSSPAARGRSGRPSGCGPPTCPARSTSSRRGAPYAWTVHEDTTAPPGYRRVGGWGRAAEPLADGFHTYAVDWTPGCLRFSLDGRTTGFVDLDREPRLRRALDGPVDIRLNLQVGSSYWGRLDPERPGTTGLPATFEIDHVRVFRPRPARD